MTIKKRIACVAAVVIVAALSLAGVSETCALIPLAVIAVSFVGGLVSWAVGVIVNRDLVARGFGWLFVLAVASLLPAWIVIAIQGRATEHVAASVVTAIETYRVVHGDYPPSLDRLVPEHFSTVPQTRFGLGGTSFFYIPHTNGFLLGYMNSFTLSRIYDSKTRTWEIRD